MKPVSTTELPALEFVRDSDAKHKVRMQSNKIGWLHSFADKPGAEFDVTIKDGLGRVKYQGRIKSNTERAGSLLNISTLLGEEIEVSVENLKNAEKVKLYIN